jgi:hypothetical protein
MATVSNPALGWEGCVRVVSDIQDHAQFQATLARLRERLPSFAQRYLAGALAGDLGEVLLLLDGTLRGHRGACLHALHSAGLAPDVFRAALLAGWNHDHDVLRATISSHTLRAMFRAARCPLPDHIPETVRIWRGTWGLSKNVAQRGYSWTLDRDVACWFAHYPQRPPRARPLVLTADVNRGDILAYVDARREREVVCFGVREAMVDGTPESWAAGAALFRAFSERDGLEFIAENDGAAGERFRQPAQDA